MTMPNAQQRLYIYGVYLAAMPILVFYGLVSNDAAPLWIALGAAVLSTGSQILAIKNITPDAPVVEDNIEDPLTEE